MNAVFTTAMPTSDALASRMAGAKITRMIEYTVIHTSAPMRLNARCTTAARFASFFAPTLESIAVTQVPIASPMTIGMAAP